jgi:hypothetical protein
LCDPGCTILTWNSLNIGSLFLFFKIKIFN